MEEIKNANPLAKRGRPRKSEAESEQLLQEIKPGPEVDDEEKVTLTGAEFKKLKALLDGNASTFSESFFEKMAEKIAEGVSGKHKSAAQKENDRRQQEQMRNQLKQELRNKELNRLYCRHRAGTNPRSDVPHPHNAYTSIIWHNITPQLLWGVCSICQREFWPTDTDYRYWRSQPSYNKRSGSGERDADMMAWMAEEHPEPFGTKTGRDPRDIIREQSQPVF